MNPQNFSPSHEAQEDSAYVRQRFPVLVEVFDAYTSAELHQAFVSNFKKHSDILNFAKLYPNGVDTMQLLISIIFELLYTSVRNHPELTKGTDAMVLRQMFNEILLVIATYVASEQAQKGPTHGEG